MLTPSQDLGANTRAVYCGTTQAAGAPIAIIAAGAGDNVQVVGATVDRLGTSGMPDSAVVTVAGLAALAAAATLTVAAEIQESVDGNVWAAAEVLYAATIVATGPGGGGNVTFLRETDVNLRGRLRFFRINVTPDLSAGAVDTAVVTATALLGGASVVPVA